MESVSDFLNTDSQNCKEAVGSRYEKIPEISIGRSLDSEADLSALDTVYGSAPVWLPCYDVDGDICSGSERSLEDTHIFDSPEIECLAPNMPMNSPMSLSDDTCSFDHQIESSKEQPVSNPKSTICHLSSDTETSKYGTPSLMHIKSESSQSEQRISGAGSLSQDGNNPYFGSNPQNSRASTQVARQRQTSNGGRVFGGDYTTGRQGRLSVQGSNPNGGSSSPAVGASRSPKTCAYEGCPCPLQSNKWRTVTSGTAAGQQV